MGIKLTFYTNCILRNELDKNKSYYFQIKKLEYFESINFVKIYKTDVQDTEIWDFRSRLEKSSKFKELKVINIWDNSRWSHSLFYTKEDAEIFNDLKDIMTLHTHKKYNNDYLITENIRDFIFDKDNTNIINPNKLNLNILEKIISEEELKIY